jgi:DNA topoisomerase-1
LGSSGRFRYVDARGNPITDERSSSGSGRSSSRPPEGRLDLARAAAKLQATGVDAAGRRQYLYHPTSAPSRSRRSSTRLIRFAERLPELRAANAEHMDHDMLDRLRVSAIATR